MLQEVLKVYRSIGHLLLGAAVLYALVPLVNQLLST